VRVFFFLLSAEQSRAEQKEEGPHPTVSHEEWERAKKK
jgi:hypothetical protein